MAFNPSHYLRAHAATITLLGLLMAISPVLAIWAQVLMAQCLGNIVADAASVLDHVLILLATVTFASIGLSLFATWYGPRVTTGLSTALREELHRRVAFAHIVGEDLTTGDIITRINTDIPTYVQSSLNLVSVSAGVASTLVTIAVLGWTMSPRITVIWMLSAPLYYILPFAFRAKLKVLAQQSRGAWGKATNSLLRAAYGADTLKVLTDAHTEMSIGVEDWKAANRTSVRETVANGIIGWGQNSMQNAMTLVILTLGIIAARHHSITPGAVIAFILLQQRLGSSVLALAQIPVARMYVKLSLARLERYYSAGPYFIPSGPVEPYAVRLDGVTIAVAGRILLDDTTMRIGSGGITLIVGPNGAGKTQLIRSLVGLRDVAGGSITWDVAMAGHIGYVPQNVPVFEGDLRYNLALGRDIADATLSEMLDGVGWEGRGLDDECNTEASLSGGELKRIALVRTLLDRPKAVLVDELESGMYDPSHVIRWVVERSPMVIAVTHRPELWPETAVCYELCDAKLRARDCLKNGG